MGYIENKKGHIEVRPFYLQYMSYELDVCEIACNTI